MLIGECLFCKETFQKRECKRKFCSLKCSNNFNKNGLKRVDLPVPSKELAEFIGICLGDGCVSQYQVSVTLNKNADKDYIPHVYKLMQHLFPGINVSLIQKTKDNAVDVRLYSKTIVDFLQNMGIVSNKKIIPQWIFKNELYKIACVRGLVDTEGSISYKRYTSKSGERLYKQLNFRNTDMEFMRFVRDTLLSLGLKPTRTLKKSLYISSGRDIEIYRKIIDFGNPKLYRRSLVNSIKLLECL